MDYTEPQFFRVMQYAVRADRDVVDMVRAIPTGTRLSGFGTGYGTMPKRPLTTISTHPAWG